MRIYRLALLGGFAALVAIHGAALAQNAAPAPAGTPTPPERPLTESARLERLFQRLKAAPNAEAARPIAAQIERAFERSGSDTADLLLARARQAITAKNFETALDLIDYVLTLKPDWAEAYNRRALVHFLLRDEDSALRDIRETLAREPRHFQAIAGLGAMLRGNGKKKAALDAFRKVIELHPYYADLKDVVEKLQKELDGQPI